MSVTQSISIRTVGQPSGVKSRPNDGDNLNVQPSPNPTPPGSKVHLRSDILSHRRELSAADLEFAARRVLAALLGNLHVTAGSTVAAYAPVGTEPGGYLTQALSDAGHRVLLPVVREDLDLDWAQFTGAQHTTEHGLSEPDGKSRGRAAVREAAAIIVPACAVDTDGTRLGKGGGCYDRALARVAPGIPVIALLHDGEFPRPVPREAHDRPVNAVITPGDGFVSLGTHPAPRGGQNPRDGA